MRYALYVDPARRDIADVRFPPNPPAVAYIRLTDLDRDGVLGFDGALYPRGVLSMVEIHPAQIDFLRYPIDRLVVEADKSKFDNLNAIKAAIQRATVDMTFNWDHRFHLNYYIKMLQYWVHCGVQQFSIYGLENFQTWLRLRDFLFQHGYVFYDRYHACLRGCESPYQKHLAGFGDLVSIGGWSRVTDDGVTRTRAPGSATWVRLSPDDARRERWLFALADRDGMAARGLTTASINAVVAAGLALQDDDRILPTDKGLWDTVALASQLQQNPDRFPAI
jgi:hypothetical protein